jgi:hypothetical protein
MRRFLLPGLPLVLLCASLSGCGLLDGSDSLDDALEVVPASLSEVRFVDRAAMLERLDVEELGSDPSDEELKDYIEASREFPAYTGLDQYLVVMLEDAPFSAQDIDWEVAGYDADGGFGQVWRMDDDLDLDDVADDLVDAGYQEEDSSDGRSLSIDLNDVGEDEQYFVTMQSLTILPDDHLIVTGPLTDDFVEVISDDADSAVDKDSFEELADGTDDAEFAALGRDDLACLGTRVTAEGAEELEGLGHPEQTGFFVHGDDGETRSVLLFDDDQAAEDDAEEREDYLAGGTDPVSGQPFAEIAESEVDTDGPRVQVDLEFDEPQMVASVVSRRGYAGFSACGP